MKLISLIFILSIVSSLDFLSCNQSALSKGEKANMQYVFKSPHSLNMTDANYVLRQVENRYNAFIYYKTKAVNFYLRNRLGNETSSRKEIEIEYSSPSQIRAEIRDDENAITLISKDNTTSLLINAEKKKDFDDVYWGLTSTEFGDGAFFEVGKILVLKERGKGEISSIRNLQNLVILREEIIDERPCYKIQGSVQNDDLMKITYWIDKESFLVRQYERLVLAKKLPNDYSKTVETYTDIETR